MRSWVMVAVLAVAANAAADDYKVDVPAGWVEQPPEVMAAQVAKLRAIKGTKSLDISLYMSPDNQTQLTVMRSQMQLPGAFDQKALLDLDSGMAKGTANAATKHLSDDRRFEGNRLIGTALDENNATTIDQVRNYIPDRDKIVHMLNVVCAGPADALAECRQAQKSMRFEVANAIDLPARAEDPDSAYRIGQIVGSVLGVLLVVWLVRWLRRRV